MKRFVVLLFVFQAGLEILDPEEREAIVLREWDGLTFAEMGERLGTSLDTARRRYNRSFDRLTEKVWALRSGDLASALEEPISGSSMHDHR